MPKSFTSKSFTLIAMVLAFTAATAVSSSQLLHKPSAKSAPPADVTPPGMSSEIYASGSRIVYAKSQQAFRVYVDPKKMKDVRFVGHFEVTDGDTKDLEVYLLNEDDYTRWIGSDRVVVAGAPKPPGSASGNTNPKAPLYVSGKESSGNIDLPVPDSGSYYLVFSNQFAQSGKKTFNLDLKIQYKALQ